MKKKEILGKKKFERGYLTKRKAKLWGNIGINILMAFAIFIFGLLLNKMDVRNIFSVIAILFILPIARSLSILSVLFKRRELEEEILNKAEERIEGKGVLLYSPVFTSKERAMHLDLVALFPTGIIAYVRKPENKTQEKQRERYKRNIEEAKKYLDAHLKNQGRGENLVIYEDFEKFLKAFPEKTIGEKDFLEIEKLKTSMEYFVV